VNAVNYFKPISISRILGYDGVGMVEIWNIMDSIFLLTLFWQIRNRKLRKSKRKCNEKQNGKQTKIKENYLIIINKMVLGKQGVRIQQMKPKTNL